MPSNPGVTGKLLLQLLLIVLLSSLAIAAMGHFVLEAPFIAMWIVVLVAESMLAIGFLIYRAFVTNLG